LSVACSKPLRAYRLANGAVVFAERGDVVASLDLPCGQCWRCRLERSRQWAVRCVHEAQLHELNCFVTLTYDVDPVSLVYKDFQDFVKRLRFKRWQDVLAFGPVLPSVLDLAKVRYFVVGEYGEHFERPHFHALLFGLDFADKRRWRKSPSGSVCFRSAALDRLWSHGYAELGDVNFRSAAYCARYVMAKRVGKDAEAHYRMVDGETGEVSYRTPEFNRMSLKPGIGAGWLDKFQSDVFPRGKVVVNGHESPSPRYYDKRFKASSPEQFEALAFARECSSRERFADNTYERLLVKEDVAIARSSRLVRSLK